jgi:hypothetical protein
MPDAWFEVHELDSLGLPARQITITGKHGETTRICIH